MARELTVSIDAMGGDLGPGIVVDALTLIVIRHPAVRFILHGDEAQLNALLAKQPKLLERMTVKHAPARVTMEDKPSHVVRRGHDTSMWRCIESIKAGEAEVAVSAGNTGALMACAMFQLRTIEGIDRPAIAALWPTLRGQSVVLDVGANVTASVSELVDFAVMGQAFAHVLLNLERPTLGLLNVGEEEMKGNDAVKGAAQVLRGCNLPMEFHGFVEGDDISKGTTDVVVTDGFTGNIALKTAEGTANLVVHYLRSALTRSFFGQLGAFIASGALKTLRRKLDPRSVNGGVFLGLNGVVVKSHGGADAIGFSSALDMAIDMAKADITSRILSDRAGITVLEAAS